MKKSTLADGRKISWREAGSGPAVVLLHGWSMSSAVFAEVIEELSGDFHLLAPDLRGHGASDTGTGYGLADFAADLAEWIQVLDLREFALVGWSLGGQVALELCPALRERLRRLILVGTTPRFTAAADWTAGLPELQVRAMARDLKRNYLKTMGDFFALQFAGEELPHERYRRIADFAVRDGRLPEPEVALAALETLRLGDQRLPGGSTSPLSCSMGNWTALRCPAPLSIWPCISPRPNWSCCRASATPLSSASRRRSAADGGNFCREPASDRHPAGSPQLLLSRRGL
jgi:pimeloyl-[acyl-carrier protein] methyl ester esterase